MNDRKVKYSPFGCFLFCSLSREIAPQLIGSALNFIHPSKRFSEMGTIEIESHPLRPHRRSFCAHPAGRRLLSSRPKEGRRASTYNRSEKFSHIWYDHLDGEKKRLINKLVHFCMIDGKKTKSRVIVSKTISRLSKITPDVITLSALAIENVKPTREVKKVRIAGTTHNVPKINAKKRQETNAFRWIMEAAVKRRIMSQNNESFDQCLSAEILEASQKKGSTRKRRDDLHKLAEANRSFAHYRWW